MEFNNISYAVRTVIGNREEQQDCVGSVIDEDLFSAVVCDGMGGLNGGQLASNIAVNEVLDAIEDRDSFESIPDMFINCIDILDEAVYTLTDSNGNKLDAGTTVVAVCIVKNDLYWMSVGDSRLYIFRNDEMVQATRDHNYSLYLDSVKDTYSPTTDDLDQSEALISFIGMGGISTMDISNNPVSLLSGDVLLITSDGLYKSVPDSEIKSVINSIEDVEQAADELLKRAETNVPDTKDNISFVIIKMN